MSLDRRRAAMRLMGLPAIYQHPRTTVPHPERLYGSADRSAQIRFDVPRLFRYVATVRKVQHDGCGVLRAMEGAVARFDAPELIFNTDLGSQSTSPQPPNRRKRPDHRRRLWSNRARDIMYVWLGHGLRSVSNVAEGI
jgi:hypothetical protein